MLDDMDYNQKMLKCNEYLEALEEEQKKIQVFQRELPLCLELVTKAIESCRKELSGQSECSERTTSDCGGSAAVFEEFIPIKGMSSCSSDENDNKDETEKIDMNSENNGDKKKSDWLRYVQLWNQSSDPNPKEDKVMGKKVTVVDVKRNAGAFQPFQKENNMTEKTTTDSQPLKAITPTPTTTTTSSSTAETVGAKRESDQHKQSQSQRKQRRCWSPELHRRFVNALQQLGGSHAATPKQIRDLMKVDGLTNDEVKSHLQKYRLHTRRPVATPTVNNGGENPQQPQFMVVEGIWVPSHEAASNRVYAPVAAKPPQSSTSAERSNRRCKSPATPSSRHTPRLLPLS